MRIDKRSFIIIEIVLLVFVLTTLTITWINNKNTRTKRIFVIMENSEESNRNAFRYGLKMAAQDLDLDVVIVSAGDLDSSEDELTLVAREVDYDADGLIIEPVSDKDISNAIKEIVGDMPILFVNNSISVDEKNEMPIIRVDNYKIGYDLGKAVVNDFGEKINNITFGILSYKKDVESSYNRETGFKDALGIINENIVWSISEDVLSVNEANTLSSLPKVDVVIGLDDKSVTLAGEYAATKRLHGAVVYGIGNSTEAIYYLENRDIDCLFVPDDFKIGYQSFSCIADKLTGFNKSEKDFNISYIELRREDVFSEENQRLLYTMSQ